MQITEIITDETMRELREHGTSGFAFKYYLENIHAFEKHYIEWHWHNEFEWIFVKSGEIDLVIGSKRIRMQEGDGAFINSKVIHRMEAEKEALMPNILFAPEFIAPADSAVYQEYVLPVLNSGCAYVLLRKADERMEGVLGRICEIFGFACEAQADKLDIQIGVNMLWRDFLNASEDAWNGSSMGQDVLVQSRIRMMMQFVADNYMEKITLEDIALSANVSKSEALRCFHKAIHATPVNYLIDYRLNRAKERLLASSDTVTQIAGEVGIDNVSYFVRIFTRRFGMTPGAFRERSW